MITWINAKKEQPKEKPRTDDDGYKYTSSDMVLLWTTSAINPLALGCYEGGEWYINSCGEKNRYDKVLYWAMINDPEGHLVRREYDEC